MLEISITKRFLVYALLACIHQNILATYCPRSVFFNRDVPQVDELPQGFQTLCQENDGLGISSNPNWPESTKLFRKVNAFVWCQLINTKFLIQPYVLRKAVTSCKHVTRDLRIPGLSDWIYQVDEGKPLASSKYTQSSQHFTMFTLDLELMDYILYLWFFSCCINLKDFCIEVNSKKCKAIQVIQYIWITKNNGGN